VFIGDWWVPWGIEGSSCHFRDWWSCNCYLLINTCFFCLFIRRVSGFCLSESLLFITGRLFCTVGVHPTRCKVDYYSWSLVTCSDFMCSKFIYKLWFCWSLGDVPVPDGALFFFPFLLIYSGVWREWGSRKAFSGSLVIGQRGNAKRKGMLLLVFLTGQW